MKKRLLLIGLVLTLSLMLAACGNQDETPGGTQEEPNGTQQEQNENTTGTDTDGENTGNEENGADPAGSETENGAQEAGSGNETDAEDSGNETDVSAIADQIRSDIKIGSSEEDVTGLLGDANQVVETAMDGATAWRYDFPAKEEYTYDSETDTPDLDSLKNGNLNLQAFIIWDEEGKVKGYSLYQPDGEGNVQVIHLLEDGTEKEETI